MGRWNSKLQRVVRAEVLASGRTQHEIAQQLGITPKHLCQVLRGECGLRMDLAEDILKEVGMELVVYAVPSDDCWMRQA